jgi:hypothetical protein
VTWSTTTPESELVCADPADPKIRRHIDTVMRDRMDIGFFLENVKVIKQGLEQPGRCVEFH